MAHWQEDTPDNIRVCASSPPFRYCLTWYRSGEIYWYDRDTGQSEWCGYAGTLDDFNAELYEWKIQPVGMGRTGKREEKITTLARLTF